MAIDAGVPTKEIALSIGVDRTTIWRISKRYTETGLIGAIPRSPRKPKIDERTFRAAFRELQQKRRQSLTVFRSILRDRYNVEYSRAGIYYIMKKKGITAKIRSRKPMISKRNRLKRIAIAKAHRNWTKEDWGRVIWTDESKFEFVRTRGRSYTYALHHSKTQNTSAPRAQMGGKSVCMWGCFKNDRMGMAAILAGNLNSAMYLELLDDEGKRSIKSFKCGSDFIWMQDNAPAHKAKIVMQKLRELGWEVLDWPPYSPDLNPIENLWAILKNRLYGESCFTNKQAIRDRIQEEWTKLH